MKNGGNMAQFQPKDITGEKYGKLTAIYRTNERDKKGAYVWYCVCDCGNGTFVSIDNLRKNGGTQSCGCVNKNKAKPIQEYENKKRIELATLTSEWEYVRCVNREKCKHIIKCRDCGSEKMLYSFAHIPTCITCMRIQKKQLEEQIKEQDKYKKCAICGARFEPIRSTAMYCCAQCKDKAKRIKHKDTYKERNKINKRLRESRARENGAVDYSITLTKLIERDKHICQLCGRTVNENDYVYRGDTFIAGNDYPSIDHIKPLSKGGVHQWDNVQLAHRLCNSIKKDKE